MGSSISNIHHMKKITMKSCIREIPSIHAIVAFEMPGTRGIETKVLACYNPSEICLGATSQKMRRHVSLPDEIRNWHAFPSGSCFSFSVIISRYSSGN